MKKLFKIPAFQKAAILYKPMTIKLKKIKVPKINDHSILLKVVSCSICGSDLRIFYEGSKRIDYPRIMGHEISGIVVKKGKKVNE